MCEQGDVDSARDSVMCREQWGERMKDASLEKTRFGRETMAVLKGWKMIK